MTSRDDVVQWRHEMHNFSWGRPNTQYESDFTIFSHFRELLIFPSNGYVSTPFKRLKFPEFWKEKGFNLKRADF